MSIMAIWYLEGGTDSDVVVSTRIRLARNIVSLPFPNRMTTQQGKLVSEQANEAILSSNSVLSKEFEYIPIDKTEPVDIQALVEMHLASPQMLQKGENRGVLLSKDGRVSIMINEEDHIRIQCIFGGYALNEAWDLANKIDNVIEERIDYAYHEDYGYLTSCPTNTGTGLRASVMLHLPALSISGNISSLVAAVNKLGMAVRGLYGEGSEALGDYYQVSNQVTLGVSEQEAIQKLKDVVDQIIQREREVRTVLAEGNDIALKDKLLRAYGILKNAYVLSSGEFMKLLSNVRLGVNLGFIDNTDIKKLSPLIVQTQPANIIKQQGKSLSVQERDIIRAQIVRNSLN